MSAKRKNTLLLVGLLLTVVLFALAFYRPSAPVGISVGFLGYTNGTSAFFVVGSFQVLVFAFLTNLRGLWAAVAFILSIVTETYLFRSIVSPSS